MGAERITRLLILGLSLTLLVAFVVIRPADGIRTTVGDRTDVPGVENNEEVQELGRFCVKEYNLKNQEGHGPGDDGSDRVKTPLTFGRVLEAQQQVVSGKKYFLRIEVTLPDGTTRMFDSVVLIKPWLKSKELLEFSPVVNSVL